MVEYKKQAESGSSFGSVQKFSGETLQLVYTSPFSQGLNLLVYPLGMQTYSGEFFCGSVS